MFVKCSNCGAEHDHYWMIAINTGAKTQWLCWQCYKEGQRQANCEEKNRSKRIDNILKYRMKK